MDDSRAAAYEPDVYVLDVDPRPARRRREPTDEELEMQVLAGGTWHRRMPDLGHTACGQRIASQFSPLRRHDLSEPLCSGCFTPFELQTAKARAEADREGTT